MIDTERLLAYIALGEYLENQGLSLDAIRAMAGAVAPEHRIDSEPGFSIRTINTLKHNHIGTFSMLEGYFERDLRDLGLDDGSIEEIRSAMAARGHDMAPATLFTEKQSTPTLMGTKEPLRIEALEFSVRTYNRLKLSDINTVDDLAKMTELDLLNIKSFGQKSVEEVERKLQHLGITLQPGGRTRA